MARSPADPAADVEWFERTEHCGGCGNPGDYCTCTQTTPCGCRGLHQMGSGREPDALERFAEVPASAEQGSLFGEGL